MQLIIQLQWSYLSPLDQLWVFRLKFTESSASNQLKPYCLQGQKLKSLTPPTSRLPFLVWTGSLTISRKCHQHQGLGDLGQAWGQSWHDRAIRQSASEISGYKTSAAQTAWWVAWSSVEAEGLLAEPAAPPSKGRRYLGRADDLPSTPLPTMAIRCGRAGRLSSGLDLDCAELCVSGQGLSLWMCLGCYDLIKA